MIISNLPEGTTEDDLKDLLPGLRYESIDLKPDRYAVVTFVGMWERARAAEELENCFRDGRYLRISPARW